MLCFAASFVILFICLIISEVVDLDTKRGRWVAAFGFFPVVILGVVVLLVAILDRYFEFDVWKLAGLKTHNEEVFLGSIFLSLTVLELIALGIGYFPAENKQ